MSKILPGVLDDEKHARLWQCRDSIVRDAGIQLHFLYGSIDGLLAEQEERYARRYRYLPQDHIFGLVYPGFDWKPPMLSRMSAMAGLFLRNFIRVRLLTMTTLLEHLEDHYLDDFSVVLVPDFHAGMPAQLPAWRVKAVHGWLIDRWSNDQQTVLGVADMSVMTKDYGRALSEHLQTYFGMVEP